ncbi:MAG: peptidylprolyl isomerase [Faecousia sp.]
MEKCKYCQEELTEGSTVCPHCGKDNASEEETAAAREAASVENAAEEPRAETVEQAPKEPAAETAEEPASETAGEQPADEAPTEIKEGAKATPGRIAIAVAAVVVLAAALVALIAGGLNKSRNTEQTTLPEQTTAAATETAAPATVPADGNPDDVTCKGSYTVSDEDAAAAKDTVVATMGDVSLTNGQLQVYYWNVVNSVLSSNYGYSLMYSGQLDYTQPLDTQLCAQDNSLTWQQFFLSEALNFWQMYQSLALEAKDAGLEMPAEDREYLDGLAASLEETAALYGLDSVEELLLHNVGPGAGLEEFAGFQELYYQGKPYYTAETAKFVPTPEDLDAYFTENESYYAENGVTREGKFVDVRHILVMPEGGTTGDDGTTTYSEEEWAACEAKAQELLDQWLAGDATEDSFAALAEEKSEDGGSNTNGGLYENVYEGQMVEPFEQWCFDESRANGDYGLVRTDYGYHVMYFVGSTPIWEYYAESGWVSQQTENFIAGLAQEHPMEVDYSAIKLGYINLGG